MLKLTRHQPTQRETLIRIDGRLDAENLDELRGLLASAPGPAGLTLDLSGVTSIDREGRDLLVRLRRDGCRFQGGSLYVNVLLGEAIS